MIKILRNLALLLALASSLTYAGAIQVFSNNAVTTLASPANSTTTTLSVSSSAAFPTLSGGNWFIATIQHLVSGIVTADEIVKVTAVSGSTWTVVRGQEGTVAVAWASGDTVALLPTAGGLAQFQQPTQVQSQSYNYAADTGTVNAYVVTLNPALTASVVGMPINFKAAHTNTGISTFNAGLGNAVLTLPSGNNLSGGEIVAGGYYTVVYTSSNTFQLIGTNSNVVITDPISNALQTITGPLQDTNSHTISGSSVPYLQLINTSAAANTGKWLIQDDPTQLVIEACPDSLSGCSNAITVNRVTGTVTSVNLGGTAQTGTTQAASDNSTDLATTAYTTNAVANLNSALTPQLMNLQTGIGSTTIAYQPSGVTGIGTGYTAVIATTNLVANATYVMEFSAPITYNSSTSNTLESRVCYVVGASCTAVTTVGGGVNMVVEGPTTGSNSNIVYGNAAGMTGVSIFNSTAQNVVLRGEFTMPATTLVTYELAVTTGTLNVGAGAYVRFDRVN